MSGRRNKRKRSAAKDSIEEASSRPKKKIKPNPKAIRDEYGTELFLGEKVQNLIFFGTCENCMYFVCLFFFIK